MITEFQKGHVYISKKHINKIFDLLEADNDEGIERLLEADKAERLDASDFNPEFIKLLRSDLKTLRAIEEMWRRVRRDPKWDRVSRCSQSPKLRIDKVDHFYRIEGNCGVSGGQNQEGSRTRCSSFHRQLGSIRPKSKSLRISMRRLFDPSDEFRILVATEVLSEGVNLHRSNIVFNYDIPWNPTRLIQRVGRVNRVDTKFDTIHTYNFFPNRREQ